MVVLFRNKVRGSTSLYIHLSLLFVVCVIILKFNMLNISKWASVKLPLLFSDISPYT